MVLEDAFPCNAHRAHDLISLINIYIPAGFLFFTYTTPPAIQEVIRDAPGAM